ncbi:MAG: hypothetical protein IT232_04725 [Flavobacteriales bacterium]|nr:hypothetical protein [Flavobacteriales bacterium]
MKLTTQNFFLEFNRPFVLAHGTRNGTPLVFVKIEHKGSVGIGEASLPPYRKETQDSVKTWINSKYKEIQECLSLTLFQCEKSIPFSDENPSASAALQSAIINWYVNHHQIKLSDVFGCNQSKPKLTLTITKSDTSFLHEKLSISSNFDTLKLKLTGNDDDFDFVQFIRKHTHLPFCVDLNQGYTDKEDAIKLIEKLEKINCLLIEQPLKDKNHDEHFWLKTRTQIPIVADESICTSNDLKQYYEAYSGVNIKLMKCGGLFQAKKMLDFINSNTTDYLKLIGCMSESSLGVYMAAQFASFFDMADLDSPYLNKNDPFTGFKILNKKIVLSDSIEMKTQLFP